VGSSRQTAVVLRSLAVLSRSTAVCRVHPAIYRVHPRFCRVYPPSCRVHTAICRVYPLSCRVHPAFCRVYPLFYRVQLASCRVNPAFCRVHPLCWRINPPAGLEPIRRLRRCTQIKPVFHLRTSASSADERPTAARSRDPHLSRGRGWPVFRWCRRAPRRRPSPARRRLLFVGRSRRFRCGL
jgi:hypothetical protein